MGSSKSKPCQSAQDIYRSPPADCSPVTGVLPPSVRFAVYSWFYYFLKSRRNIFYTSCTFSLKILLSIWKLLYAQVLVAASIFQKWRANSPDVYEGNAKKFFASCLFFYVHLSGQRDQNAALLVLNDSSKNISSVWRFACVILTQYHTLLPPFFRSKSCPSEDGHRDSIWRCPLHFRDFFIIPFNNHAPPSLRTKPAARS